MREIKYQAFLKQEKVMVNVAAIDLFSQAVFYFDCSHCVDDAEVFEFVRNGDPNGEAVFGHIELREFTNFLDKDGKEIYEGDIIRIYNDEIDEEDSWIDEVSYHMGGFFSGDEDLLGNVHFRARIIGNIYENPELLKRN